MMRQNKNRALHLLKKPPFEIGGFFMVSREGKSVTANFELKFLWNDCFNIYLFRF